MNEKRTDAECGLQLERVARVRGVGELVLPARAQQEAVDHLAEEAVTAEAQHAVHRREQLRVAVEQAALVLRALPRTPRAAVAAEDRRAARAARARRRLGQLDRVAIARRRRARAARRRRRALLLAHGFGAHFGGGPSRRSGRRWSARRRLRSGVCAFGRGSSVRRRRRRRGGAAGGGRVGRANGWHREEGGREVVCTARAPARPLLLLMLLLLDAHKWQGESGAERRVRCGYERCLRGSRRACVWEHQLLGRHAQAASETRAAAARARRGRRRRRRRLVQEEVAGEVGSRRHCAHRERRQWGA